MLENSDKLKSFNGLIKDIATVNNNIAKENGISMLGAIRYILNQFFKQNTK
jgi:hypothetical protein